MQERERRGSPEMLQALVLYLNDILYYLHMFTDLSLWGC